MSFEKSIAAYIGHSGEHFPEAFALFRGSPGNGIPKDSSMFLLHGDAVLIGAFLQITHQSRIEISHEKLSHGGAMKHFDKWLPFLRFLLMKALLASIVLAPLLHAAEKPRNIVFILADDLGVKDINIDGSDPFYETPNLAKFLRFSVNFSCPSCHIRYFLLTFSENNP